MGWRGIQVTHDFITSLFNIVWRFFNGLDWTFTTHDFMTSLFNIVWRFFMGWRSITTHDFMTSLFNIVWRFIYGLEGHSRIHYS